MSEHQLRDDELLSRATSGANGATATDLHEGKIADFDSLQEATRAYCRILAREQRGYSDPEQINRLVRDSGLMHDDWNDDDYRTSLLDEICQDSDSHETAANEAVIDAFEAVFEQRGLDTDRVAGSREEPRSLDEVLGVADSLGAAIIRYRRDATHHAGHTRDEKKRVIAAVVTNDLQDNGRLINPVKENAYYFDEREVRVYPLHSPDFEAMLQDRYDLLGDDEGRAIIDRIERVATREGEEAAVHDLFHWDETAEQLYIHDRAGGYYAIDRAGIAHHENGENGVFFLPNDGDRLEYIPPADRPSGAIDIPGERPDADQSREAYRRVLVNRANFIDGGGLSPADQRILFDLYLHALPFGAVIPEKPILAFQGVKASGKTGTQRMLGQFLCQPSWDVRHLNSQDDFWTAVTNNPFVAFDQLDTIPDWLNDALASVATGTLHTKRKLYTTNEEAHYKPKCWAAINSREPQYNRDDVTSRLIIFTFGPLDKKYGRRAFNKPLREYHQVLWSQYLDTLEQVVGQITADHDYNPSSLRVADWVHIAKAAAEPLGYDHETVHELANRLEVQQASFTLDDDPSYRALRALKRDLRGNGLEANAEGLHENLQEKANEEQIDYNRNHHSLSMWISHHRDELKTLLGLEVEATDRENWYRLPP